MLVKEENKGITLISARGGLQCFGLGDRTNTGIGAQEINMGDNRVVSRDNGFIRCERRNSIGIHEIKTPRAIGHAHKMVAMDCTGLGGLGGRIRRKMGKILPELSSSYLLHIMKTWFKQKKTLIYPLVNS